MRGLDPCDEESLWKRKKRREWCVVQISIVHLHLLLVVKRPPSHFPESLSRVSSHGNVEEVAELLEESCLRG